MNDFVAMAEHICPVCNKTHTHNTEILIDKRLKDIPEDKRVTGMSLCEEHQKLADDGFICIIVVDESKSEISPDGTLKPENAHRTGDVLHVRRVMFNELVNAEIPEKQEIVFGSQELFDIFQGIHKKLH